MKQKINHLVSGSSGSFQKKKYQKNWGVEGKHWVWEKCLSKKKYHGKWGVEGKHWVWEESSSY